ncbi:MAG: cytochrome c3 family protein [Planctomycetota bacterium]|jgi:hypothetical protein
MKKTKSNVVKMTILMVSLSVFLLVLTGAGCKQKSEEQPEQAETKQTPEQKNQEKSDTSQPENGSVDEQTAAEITQENTGDDDWKMADNSACLTCHMNYKNEELTVNHAKMDMGCVDCHGQSNEHAADKDALTPPEIMFSKEKINSYCLDCHPKEILSPEHEKFLLVRDDTRKNCTGCHHGQDHRIKTRSRVWDKETGKLLRRDDVRQQSF